MLGPPDVGDEAVVVTAASELQEINDGAETFEFSVSWKDPRQSFDPAVTGVSEKIFQGSDQLDEVSTGWYPQVVLVNEYDDCESRGGEALKYNG